MPKEFEAAFIDSSTPTPVDTGIIEGVDTGQATVAPEPAPVEAVSSTDDKGQAEKAPEGQADPAPEVKEPETPAETKTYTPEEMADIVKRLEDSEKKAKSYDEAQKLITKSTTEAAALRKELESFKAKDKPQSDEEYVAEALADDGFKKALEAKGFRADSFFDEEGNLVKNAVVFTKEREAFKAAQREQSNTIENAIAERASAIDSAFDDIKKAHGEAFNAISPKVTEKLQTYKPEYLFHMPSEDIPAFIEKVVRSVEPKFFERTDHLKEAERLKAVKLGAMESVATPGAKGAKELKPEDQIKESIRELITRENAGPKGFS